ncbi:MAG: hypothetical protein LUH54_02515, partial [Firmicutes bacterium]|nr:hypothetical protein [Bacillota bacterium]
SQWKNLKAARTPAEKPAEESEEAPAASGDETYSDDEFDDLMGILNKSKSRGRSSSSGRKF